MLNRVAVLGFPVSHSLSPAMHNSAFSALGMDEWIYEPIEVSPGDFEARVRGMAEEGFVGANVTIPHKVAALEIADTSDEVARAIGAANTLLFEDGKIAAANTDARGLLDSIPVSPQGKSALVLGAGGAARAAVWGLRDEGADVAIWNRTPGRAQQLAEELGATVAEPTAAGGSLALDGYELIVNSTSVGLKASAHDGDELKALCLNADSFSERQIVVDLVYRDGETELLRSARRRGAQAVDGREVLVHQGAASFRIWTGTDPPLGAMREAVRQFDSR